MAKIEKVVIVSKEAHELAEGIVAVLLACKQALKDGFQPGQDVPAIVKAAVAKLPPALQGIQGVPAEFAEDKAAFARAIALGVADGVEAVLS